MRSLESKEETPSNPRSDLKTLRTLIPYLWPKDATEMRFRVLIALIFLALAKSISAGAPILYKLVIDAISNNQTTIIVVPIGIIVSYGLARSLSLAFGEFRDAVFA